VATRPNDSPFPERGFADLAIAALGGLLLAVGVPDRRARALLRTAGLALIGVAARPVVERAIRGVPRTLMSAVHDYYFEPREVTFEPRNLWSLSNAFTSAFKTLAPTKQFEVTARLGAFHRPPAAR